MRPGSRRRRGHLWAGIYVGLFGTDAEPDAEPDDAEQTE
jgi:hypothetical protein